nr:MAG TPA: hypothetical protein [Caudoviricetes sp.]
MSSQGVEQLCDTLQRQGTELIRKGKARLR